MLFRSGLAAVAALLFGYPFVQAPVGLVAAVIVAVLIARRSLGSSRLPVPA